MKQNNVYTYSIEKSIPALVEDEEIDRLIAARDKLQAVFKAVTGIAKDDRGEWYEGLVNSAISGMGEVENKIRDAMEDYYLRHRCRIITRLYKVTARVGKTGGEYYLHPVDDKARAVLLSARRGKGPYEAAGIPGKIEKDASGILTYTFAVTRDLNGQTLSVSPDPEQELIRAHYNRFA